jgi:hypothetical protein
MAKSTLICLFFAIIFISCTKKDPELKGHLLILKVDYSQPAFEGGKELSLPYNVSPVGKFPLTGVFDGEWDFAHQAILYTPTNDTVFYGGVYWMGKGEITIPKNFNKADNYEMAPLFSKPAAFPSVMNVLNQAPSFTGLSSTDYHAAWDQIKNLKIVQQYVNRKAQIAMYLYPPTVGMFDPDPAKWIILFYVQ